MADPSLPSLNGDGFATTGYGSSLPPHIHEMLTRASAQLQAHQWKDLASQDDSRSCLAFREDPPQPAPKHRGSTRRHARPRQQPEPCHTLMALTGSDPSQSLLRFHGNGKIQLPRKSTVPAGPGYSYSHAPRTQFGDQQSDPQRRIQIQINYMDSLALRVPTPASLTAELQAKENLRARLTKVAQEALGLYADTHGYSVGPKAIDFKCFGSLRNGFALPGADLDLVMTTHSSNLPKQLEIECPQILEKAFSEAGFDVRMISRARVPIIKLCEKSDAGIRCDINFTGNLAIYNTELLRCYALCDDRIRLVGVFVKMWAKARSINNPYLGTMCSYGYILMVIHYLVNVADPPLAPNLQLTGHNKASIVNGCDVQFFNDEAELRARAKMNAKYGNKQTVGDLLRGFFAYYGSRGRNSPRGGFDWVNNVVSIRTLGGMLPKSEKGWTTAKVDKNGHRLRYLIAIEDPFEHDHNVARTVKLNGVKAIRAEFSRAHTIINRIQEIPGAGWEWRTDAGDIGEDFLADAGCESANMKLAEQPKCYDSVPDPNDDIQRFDALGMSHTYQYSPLIHPGTSPKAQKQQAYREDFRRRTTSTANTMRRLLHMPEVQSMNSSGPSFGRLNLSTDRGLVMNPRSTCSPEVARDRSNHSDILYQRQPNAPPFSTGVVLDPRQFHGPDAIRDRTSVSRVPNGERETIINSDTESFILSENLAIPDSDLLSALPFYEGSAC